MPAPNTIADFWKQVDKTDDCWNWTGTKPSGRYGRFKYRGKKYAAHRFSWQIHNGEIPDGKHVLHRCDNPACVRPDHLFLGDHTVNMRDMFAKGRRRILRGSQQGQAKITEPDVISIRKRYSAGERQVLLAAEYGVDQTTISKIVLRQSWQHVA